MSARRDLRQAPHDYRRTRHYDDGLAARAHAKPPQAPFPWAKVVGVLLFLFGFALSIGLRP